MANKSFEFHFANVFPTAGRDGTGCVLPLATEDEGFFEAFRQLEGREAREEVEEIILEGQHPKGYVALVITKSGFYGVFRDFPQDDIWEKMLVFQTNTDVARYQYAAYLAAERFFKQVIGVDTLVKAPTPFDTKFGRLAMAWNQVWRFERERFYLDDSVEENLKEKARTSGLTWEMWAEEAETKEVCPICGEEIHRAGAAWLPSCKNGYCLSFVLKGVPDPYKGGYNDL